jgi:Ca2+-binding RTX toxin-like protein
VKARWTILATFAALVAGVLAVTSTAWAGGTTPTCFGQTATIVGTPGDDVLMGADGTDVIVGKGGNDTIYGEDEDDPYNYLSTGGDDFLCGNGGIDRIEGDL